MIKALIIGSDQKVKQYSTLISEIDFFGKPTLLDNSITNNFDVDHFDAFIITNELYEPFTLLKKIIRAQKPLYLTHQSNLTKIELDELVKIWQESNNIIFFEQLIFRHPLINEFLGTNAGYIVVNYERSIKSKQTSSVSIFDALCLLSILSPMQVKRIDVSTLEITQEGKPEIIIRLKMYDGSVCFIKLKVDNKNDHIINLDTDKGKFTFNFSSNYIENQYGKKFLAEPLSIDELMKETLSTFALKIIMNKKPTFNFFNYQQVFLNLLKITSILNNSM